MSTRAQLSETLNRLLPGEQYKRIREAILASANYSGQRTDQLRQSIDEANRVRTGLLVSGTIDITSDTSATLSGYAWVVDFAVQQPTAASTLTITAPDSLYPREDYFIGTDSGSIIYRAGTVDSLGNSRPPSYNSATEVVLVRVVRNPDSDEIITVDPGDNLIDFVEQNIIPLVRDGKLKNSGIQALLNSLGEIIGYQFPTNVKGSPAVNDDEFVTKAQLPAVTQYGLLSGGTIQYSGTGQKYLSSLAVLAIGETLIAPASEQTLDAADATFDRFDVLGWEYVSAGIAALFYLKGTAAASPTIPQVNPETQVQGKVILVPAASSAPSGITTEPVYLDNAEWTVTKSGTGTLDADSTDNPKTGPKAVKSTATANNYRVRFTRSTTLDLSTLTDATLGLDLDLIAAMANNQSLAVVFLDAAGNAASNQLFLQLNKSLLDYQFLGLALSQFNFLTTVIKSVEFIFGTKGGGTFAGFYLDNVKIQGGVEQPGTVGTPGEKGWSPVLAVVTDGSRRVLQVSDWTGGQGTKPAIGQYIGASGLTSTIGDAVDIRGAAGVDGVDGTNGEDGREVEFQNNGTHIQWRYVGDASWTNLVSLSAITGPAGDDGADGREIELQVNGSDMLQWRYVGDPTWTDLFDFSGLGGGSIDQDNKIRVIEISQADIPSAYTKADIVEYLNTLGLIIDEFEIIAVEVVPGFNPWFGLIAYYKLDETTGTTATDTEALVNGTVNGSVTLGATGKLGTAFSFPGSAGSYVGLTNNSAFQINQGSISLWVKCSSPGSSYRGLFVKQLAYSIFLINGVVAAYSWAGSVGDKSTGVNVADNNWHHIVLLFDSGTGNNKFYIDGSLALTFSMTISSQGNQPVIGAGDGAGSTQNIAATVDEVAIFNTIISEEQIAYLYNSGAGNTR